MTIDDERPLYCLNLKEKDMKLLLAEDDKAFADAIFDVLIHQSYLVEIVDNDKDIYERIVNGSYDGIILDLSHMRPYEHDFISKLRQNNHTEPILVFGDNPKGNDVVRVLDAGADDYLTKPFSAGEFLSRIRAMLRRREAFHPDILTFGDLTLDKQVWSVSCNGNQFVLPRHEYRVMEILMEHTDICIPSEVLMAKVWGRSDPAGAGSVWLYISRLRERLKEIGTTVVLSSRRHVGYRLIDTSVSEPET